MSVELGRRRRPANANNNDVESEGEEDVDVEGVEEGDIADADGSEDEHAESAAEDEIEDTHKEEHRGRVDEKAESLEDEEFEAARVNQDEVVDTERHASVSESADGSHRETVAAEFSHRAVNKEDRKNPTFVPRSGQFYLHDTRGADEELPFNGNDEKREVEVEETRKVEEQNGSKKEAIRKTYPNQKDDAWDHDLYNEKDQAPLSKDEIIRKYGYDIRAYPANAPPPKHSERTSRRMDNRRPNNRQRGRQGDFNNQNNGNDRSQRPKRENRNNDFFQPKHTSPSNRQYPSNTRSVANDQAITRQGQRNGHQKISENDRINEEYPPLTRGDQPIKSHNSNYIKQREFVRTDISQRNRQSHDLPPPLFGSGGGGSIGARNPDIRGARDRQRGGGPNFPSATVHRVTQKNGPVMNQNKPSQFDRSGSYNRSAPPRQYPRQKNNLPEWATEDPPEGMWEPPTEEESHQSRTYLPPAQSQQQRLPPHFGRNETEGQGQSRRYSSMRSAAAGMPSSPPRHQQSSSGRFGNNNNNNDTGRSEGNYCDEDDYDDEDYDSQGEADWRDVGFRQRTTPPVSQQRATPVRNSKMSTPPRRSSEHGENAHPTQPQSQSQQQQPADATAIAAATIQQLLTNPALLQQLLIAATAAVAPVGTTSPPTSGGTTAPQGHVYTQSPQQPPQQQQQQPALPQARPLPPPPPPQQQQQQHLSVSQSQTINQPTTTSNSHSQQQPHPQAAHVQPGAIYRPPVPPYYQVPMPQGPGQSAGQSGSVNATEFLNNMTPQQAAALQAAAMTMFTGSTSNAASMPPYMPAQGAHPPHSGPFYAVPVVADSTAGSGVAVSGSGVMPPAGPAQYVAASTGTPPQHSLRHAHQHHPGHH